MILRKPSVEIIASTLGAVQLIEIAGRTCYKSEDKITDNSAAMFVEMILKNGHESVIEHASATVKFICDRGVTHEIVRHRLASYSQESTRYCDYAGGHVTFIIPPWAEVKEGTYSRPADFCGAFSGVGGDARLWADTMMDLERSYKQLRDRGWKPEQARSVLPNSLKTEIVMTANFREWRHFLKLRTSSKAHPQMREVAVPLLEQFTALAPSVFDSRGRVRWTV